MSALPFHGSPAKKLVHYHNADTPNAERTVLSSSLICSALRQEQIEHMCKCAVWLPLPLNCTEMTCIWLILTCDWTEISAIWNRREPNLVGSCQRSKIWGQRSHASLCSLHLFDGNASFVTCQAKSSMSRTEPTASCSWQSCLVGHVLQECPHGISCCSSNLSLTKGARWFQASSSSLPVFGDSGKSGWSSFALESQSPSPLLEIKSISESANSPAHQKTRHDRAQILHFAGWHQHQQVDSGGPLYQVSSNSPLTHLSNRAAEAWRKDLKGFANHLAILVQSRWRSQISLPWHQLPLVLQLLKLMPHQVARVCFHTWIQRVDHLLHKL